jgi:alpha-tubulin suppressor-like RCC1 family protein
MGSLDPQQVLGMPTGVVQLSVAYERACVLTNTGAVWCWRPSGSGQQPGTTPALVDGLSAGVLQVSAGYSHTCALRTGGAVLCWGNGSNTPVQSGITNGAVHLATGMGLSCAITNDGSTWCWGSNSHGQVGNGTKTNHEPVPVLNALSGIATLSSEREHVCGVTASGGAWCWGSNEFGQVGDGTTTARLDGRLTPAPVIGLSADVSSIEAGGVHTCAVRTDGSAWCWGDNGASQLGDGTLTNRLTPIQVDFDLLNPSVTQPPASTTVTEGGTTTFSVAVVGNPSPTVQWQSRAAGQSSWVTLADTTPFNSSPYTGVKTTTLTVTNTSRSLDGTSYRAVVTSDFGQVISASALLTVDYELRISGHPANQSIVAGQSTSFAVTATVTAPTTYTWQTQANGTSTWSDVANGGVYSGADTSVLAVTNSTVALNRRRYRVILTSGAGTATSNAATLIVAGPMGATPSSLRFAATKSGSNTALVNVTDPQAITIGSAGETTAWTASADQSWVQLSATSGTGAGLLTVSIASPNTVLGTATATITITPVTAGLSPITVSVALSVRQTTSGTSMPIGQVDTPAQNATGLAGAIGFTGWAVDDIGVTSVKIYRGCVNAEACSLVHGQNVVYIGDAIFVSGARPDVEAAFPTYPQAHRAGWGMQVLTNMLPRVGQTSYGGQGAFTFYVFATDEEGNVTLLGRSQVEHFPTSVTLDNESLTKPFGTLDTPGQGATVNGTLANFGWVLTQDGNTLVDGTDVLVPVDGTTMTVYIDGAPVGTVAYNQCRGTSGNPVSAGAYCNDDIASIFGHLTPQSTFASRSSNPTRFRNLDAGRAAIGAFTFNTATLTNGMHSIAWGVTDSAGRTEGIGSRNFFVLNTGADAAVVPDETVPAQAQGRGAATIPVADAGEDARVTGRAGFSLLTPFTELVADDTGERFVRLDQNGRLELSLGTGVAAADLPPGSRLDAATGRFTWVPSVAHLGTYRLVFQRSGAELPVSVTVAPARVLPASESEIRMHIDTPDDGGTSGGAVRIAGWALDPDAFTGSGIGAIHVWARRLDQPTVGPEFVGAATLGIARPDVAAAFGPAHHHAGYALTATLAPGLYEVTVYAWNHRTARWEDARSVRVTVLR